MNWDHFRYFTLVAANGSVSRAAKAAGVSHATVLRAIQRLEGELNVRLFDHVRSGYRLTPDGDALLEHTDVIAGAIAGIQRQMKARGDEPAGDLVISTPDPSIVDLMPVLASYCKRHPAVTVSLVPQSPVHPGRMREDGVEVVFSLTNSPPEMLVGRKLSGIRFAAVRPRNLDDPETHWILWEGGNELADLQKWNMQRLGGSASLTGSTHAEAVAAVRAGVGSALLAETAVPRNAEEHERAPGAIEIGLWMLTHPDLRGDARVRSLMRHFSESSQIPTSFTALAG